MFDNLVDVSNLLVFSSLVVYALAFVSFSIDLAKRAVLVGTPAAPDQRTSLWSRLGVSFSILGLLVHLGAAVTRGLAAGGRVPWANMFEFTLTSTLLIVAVFVVAQFKMDVRYLGTFIIGLVIVLLGLTSLNYYVDPVPLEPALQSWWLVIHVVTASLSMAFMSLGFALSVLQLIQQRLERKPVGGFVGKLSKIIPNSTPLENYAYQVNIIGFILWTFTLIAGAIWADAAWGRYWGWDTKEVWTLIIWVFYAAYIHARATRGWRGTPSAWLSIIGYNTVLFNFYFVNVYFKGLHAYSGL